MPASPTNGDEVPRSIGRVLGLLEAVLAERSCNLSTAAARCELTPTTALRHLRALEARGYLHRDDVGVFSAGPTLRRIAAGLAAEGPVERIVATAQPHLDELAAATGESSYLAMGDRTHATYVAAAHGTHTIRHVGWVGQRVQLADTAVGAAFDHPGSVAARTGAVEEDITAISVALPVIQGLHFAMSILGPNHRLSATGGADARDRLAEAATALAADLGVAAVARDRDQHGEAVAS